MNEEQRQFFYGQLNSSRQSDGFDAIPTAKRVASASFIDVRDQLD